MFFDNDTIAAEHQARKRRARAHARLLDVYMPLREADYRAMPAHWESVAEHAEALAELAREIARNGG